MNLNITMNGVSEDVSLSFDGEPTDDQVKAVALELVRSGQVRGFNQDVPDAVFRDYMVDRPHDGAGEQRLFLRPKVAFG